MFTDQCSDHKSDMGDGEDHQVNVGRLTPGTSALFVCDMQVSDCGNEKCDSESASLFRKSFGQQSTSSRISSPTRVSSVGANK